MRILQSGVFARTVKKLHKNEKNALDKAVKKVVSDPNIGVLKKGDLSGVRVYKYKLSDKEFLLGYRFDEGEIVLTLLALGSHENFYRDLKRQ
ncbi:MAG: type II toxin-antitoxin system RelE/ParE family toxin [Gammaproteobacteria bacterium]|nr:type II toxin-antitoxin system RelE/ParE family toxin [Gammaproteobacteria bacterium]